MTQQEAIKNLMQSQEFLDVMEEMKNTQLNMIMYSADDSANEREFAYQRIRSLNEIMANLESIAMTGEIKDRAWKIL